MEEQQHGLVHQVHGVRIGREKPTDWARISEAATEYIEERDDKGDHQHTLPNTIGEGLRHQTAEHGAIEGIGGCQRAAQEPDDDK